MLEKAKELNIPRQNCMKSEEELEKAIKDTVIKYKEIIFGKDSPNCMECLDELRKQHVIYQKLMDDTIRKLASDGFQKM